MAHKKINLPRKNLQNLPTSFFMAQKMGEKMGRSIVL
jgi:hypothetical protein